MSQPPMLEKFQAILNKRKKEAPKRFYMNMTQAEIAELLYSTYYNEVEIRGMKMQDNSYLSKYINDIALWLGDENEKPGLFLYGYIGNGKTTMANAIRTLIHILYYSSYSSMSKSLIRVKATSIIRMYDEDINMYDKYVKSNMLYIDEFGKENTYLKTWGNNMRPLVDLIEFRYDNRLFTILTSNIDLNEIGLKYGVWIKDRFIEMFKMINFNGPSYRSKEIIY